MSTVIRILLADDHAVLRAGLKLLLGNQPDMVIVGEAADGLAVLPLADCVQPDLVLLDLSMPRLGGLEVIPLLRRTLPQVRILVLTMHDDKGYLRRALKIGASGYVLKRAVDVELLSAIRAVMNGDVYVHSSMTRVLLDGVLADAPVQTNRWATLSQREQDVLRLVAMGHTSREIAARLFLSAKTVETYRARGMEKLNIRKRASLVRYALAHGLME